MGEVEKNRQLLAMVLLFPVSSQMILISLTEAKIMAFISA